MSKKNKKTAQPIVPQCFPGHYLYIKSANGNGDFDYLCSDEDFDFEITSLDEDAKNKFEVFMQQMANAFSREVSIHLSKGNTDHWCFTFHDSETEKKDYDLVLDQHFLDTMNEMDFACAVYMLSIFVFKSIGAAVGSYGMQMQPIAVQTDYIN